MMAKLLQIALTKHTAHSLTQETESDSIKGLTFFSSLSSNQTL